MPERESDIQRAILEYLTLRGIFHYRQNTGGWKDDRGHFYRFGSKGAPDIVCVIHGKYVGLEVKTPKGHLSEDQVEFHRQLIHAGAFAYTVRSLDEAIQAIDDTLAEIHKTNLVTTP